MHAYDASKLAGPIRVRRARPKTIVTLDDVRRTLSADDLLITDDSGPIGIAGVMGGATTECDESTTDIVIEAAAFDPPPSRARCGGTSCRPRRQAVRAGHRSGRHLCGGAPGGAAAGRTRWRVAGER